MIKIIQEQKIDDVSAEMMQLYDEKLEIEIADDAGLDSIFMAIAKVANMQGYAVTPKSFLDFYEKLVNGFYDEDAKL